MLHPIRRRESRGREVELLRLLREAGGRDPEFASLQSGRSVDLESIRSTLPLDTTVLEFYLARGMLLAAILTHRDLTILPVSPAHRRVAGRAAPCHPPTPRRTISRSCRPS